MHDNWIQNRVVPLEPRYSWKTKFIIKIPKKLDQDKNAFIVSTMEDIFPINLKTFA